VRSPLLNINRACQTWHRVPEDELKARAELSQERTYKLLGQALDALMALISDLKSAREGGADDAALAGPREAQRKAQFFVDFIEAENSMGFHAPQEAVRILGESIDAARQGQIQLRDAGFKPGPRPTAAAKE
jgi:nitrite reductase (cytochrome c-552)